MELSSCFTSFILLQGRERERLKNFSISLDCTSVTHKTRFKGLIEIGFIVLQLNTQLARATNVPSSLIVEAGAENLERFVMTMMMKTAATTKEAEKKCRMWFPDNICDLIIYHVLLGLNVYTKSKT